MNRAVLIAVLVAAVALRLAAGYLLRDSFDERGNRSSGVIAVANGLATFGEFAVTPGASTAMNEPLYTFVIAAVFRTTGDNWLAVTLLQSFLCIVNAGLIYRLSILFSDDQRAALLAAVAVLFYPFYVTQSISISETVVFCCLLALSTYLTVLSVTRDRARYPLLAGLAWGLTLLVRQSTVGLLVPALLYPFLHQDFARAARKAGMIAAIAVLTVLPWVARNYGLTGKVLISSHGAIELWFAYNERTVEVLSSDITVDVMRRDRRERLPELQLLDARSFRLPIEKEVAESEIFLAAALDYVRANPAAPLQMAPLKIWKFWSWFKNPRTNALSPSAANSLLADSWEAVYTLSYLPVLVFAVGGIYLMRRNWRQHAIFLLLFAGYTALHAVVYGFTRLRVPIDQFLMVYAAVAAVAVWDSLMRRQLLPSALP